MKAKFIIIIVALLVAIKFNAAAQPWISFVENGKYGLTDSDRKIILEPIYDYIATKTTYSAGGGSVLVRIADSCFIVNIKTKQSSLLADLPRQYKRNLYCATIANGDKYGYIDQKGKVIIEGQWDFASDFADGIARVVNGDGEVLSSITYPSPGKTGFIDTTGRYVIPMEYSFIDYFRGESITRFTRGQYVCEDMFGCENPYKGSKWGLIDNTGKIVVADDKYDFIDKSILDKKSRKVIFGVTCGDKFGIIDACGVEIVPLYKEKSLKIVFEKYFAE